MRITVLYLARRALLVKCIGWHLLYCITDIHRCRSVLDVFVDMSTRLDEFQ